jgi:gluconate 2-dehydrogenase gamma chain
MSEVTRRALLATTALLVVSVGAARATIISGALPWQPFPGDPPEPARPGSWLFFTADEARAMEAIVDRIIPPDPETPGGKDAGCAVYIDRQLAGPYGRRAGLYVSPPFQKGTPQQGPQGEDTPAQLYRKSLAALDQYCHSQRGGKAFVELSAEQQDEVLHGLEDGSIKFSEDTSNQDLAPGFFDALLKDVPEGFFADPIHGGNRDMVGWRMIGFPGIRYDYRDWVGRHNERYPLPPVSIAGRADWTPGHKS